MSKPDLDAIDQREKAATPGPWLTGDEYKPGGINPWEVVIAERLPFVDLDDTPEGRANARFIASARTDVPELRAAVVRLRDLIRDLVDSDPCWFDHHGGCQAHGYLSLEPGEKCPQQEAKEMLSELGSSVTDE